MNEKQINPNTEPITVFEDQLSLLNGQKWSTLEVEQKKQQETNDAYRMKSSSIIRVIDKNVIFIMMMLLLHVRGSNSECSNNNIEQQFYVSYQSYCLMTYDGCNHYQFVSCSKVICDYNQQFCRTISGIQNQKTCSDYCCQNYNDPNNNKNSISYNFCAPPNSTSSTIPIGTILVIVCVVVFSAAIIFACVCRKIRNRDLQNQNNNVLNPSAVNPFVPISTTVDLKQYKIETQGPCLIDSKQACVICLDSNVTLRTHCGHYYHGTCLLAWLKKKPDNPCPLCMGLHYNPTKVYCISCHYGDILVNIQPHTAQQTVKNYDSHKCQSCKNLNQKSFSLNDENQSPLRDQNVSQKDKKGSKPQFNETNEPQLVSKPKRRRRMRKQMLQSQKSKSQQLHSISNVQSRKALKDQNGQSFNYP